MHFIKYGCSWPLQSPFKSWDEVWIVKNRWCLYKWLKWFALILIICFTSTFISIISFHLVTEHSGSNSTTYSLCGGEVPSNVKTIKYPESGKYKYRLDCTWTISRPGKTINAVVPKLDVETDDACKYDYLRIGSGAKLCGDVIPIEIFIGHERLSISFISDYSMTEYGFTINITSTGKQGNSMNSSRM